MKLQNFDLEEIKYKKGWTFYLQWPTADCVVWKLMIVSETANSRHEEQMIRVRHEFMVPPADYHEHVWLAWIFERIQDVEAKHEAGEFFQYKDDRPFAPHHGNGQDPYRVWFMGSYGETETKAGDDDQDLNNLPLDEKIRNGM